MIFTKTKIIAGISALVCAGSICGFILFSRALDAKSVELENHRHRMAEEKTQGEQFASLARTSNETKEQRAELFSRVLSEREIPDLLSLIETVSRERGVALEMTVADSNTQTVYGFLVLHISIKGTYDALLQTLRLFETLPYQSDVSGVSFSRGSESTGEQWQGTFDLHIVKRKDI